MTASFYLPLSRCGFQWVSHPCEHLLVVCFSVVAILLGVKLGLFIVLICISLVTHDVEHLSISFLGICLYFFLSVNSDLLPIFKLHFSWF